MAVFYVGLEGFGSLGLTNEPDTKGLVGDVTLEGSAPKLGEFKIDITTGPKTNKPPGVGHEKYWKEKPLDRTQYSSMQVPVDELWKAKGGSYVAPSERIRTDLAKQEHLFANFRNNFLDIQSKYPTEDFPPPWQTFTLQNKFGPGNLHMVQKVFEGAFEVRLCRG
jgi:mannosyl-oligosaccharide glucosidase